MKLSVFLKWILLLVSMESVAQDHLNIDSCYLLAENNYPQIKQRNYINKASEFTLNNLQKGILPQISLAGQSTYQSEVTSFSIPGVNFRPPAKDQYKFYTEVNQPLTELFTIKDQKAFQKAQAGIQTQNIEADLYKIKERINQLYFSIILTDEQLKLNMLNRKDLQTGIDKVTSAIKNGVEYKTSLDKLKAELIRNDQKKVELTAQRNAFIEMLSYFINRDLDANSHLEIPSAPNIPANITRPELDYFQLKEKSYSIQEKILNDRKIPRINLFLQSGVGQPSPLNFIARDMRPFFIGGLRFSWTINHFFTHKNDLSLLNIDKKNNALQKDIFLFNTNLLIKQQNHELIKLNQLIQTDDELVELRNSIKNTAQIQLENGIITSNDYIKEVNAEDMARQNKAMHQIQMLMAQYQLKFINGD